MAAPTGISVRISGIDPVLKAMERLSPKENRAIMVSSLVECAELVQKDAKENQIIRGGTAISIGPRGGKRKVQRPPHPTRLTSRTGTLRRSITVDRSPLPFAIEVGTNLRYGRAHELGFDGRVSVRSHWREIRQAFGRNIAARSTHIRAHSRNMHLPRRPFLEPALRATEDRFADIFLKNWRKESGE
jgi:phage gpG-like protein